MKIAVLFQYCDCPMALTSDATHAGPVFEPQPAWSEFAQVGVTQLIWRKLSVRDVAEEAARRAHDVFVPIGAVIDVLVRLIGAPNSDIAGAVSNGVIGPRDGRRRIIRLLAERRVGITRLLVAVRNLAVGPDLIDSFARTAGTAPRSIRDSSPMPRPALR